MKKQYIGFDSQEEKRLKAQIRFLRSLKFRYHPSETFLIAYANKMIKRTETELDLVQQTKYLKD